MFNKLKQFNELRKQANTLRGKLAEKSVTVENRAVTIIMDGNQEVKTLTLKNDATGGSKSSLESQLKEAVNDAIKKSQRVMANTMRESGDFKIPGLS